MEILEQLGLDTSLTYQEGSCYQHRQLLEKLRRDIEKLVRNLTEGNQLGLEQTWLTTRVLQRPLWKWLQVLPNLFHNVAALDMFHSELIRLRGELPYTKLCFRNLGDKPHSVIWPDWLTEYLQQGHFATVEFSYCTREGAPMREDRRLLLSNTKIYCL